jgi:hypothetical protein
MGNVKNLIQPVGTEPAAPLLLADVRELIESARTQLSQAANSALTMVY